MFEILYADDVSEELQRLHARDRAIIVDRIKKQLRYEPAKATRAKKLVRVARSCGGRLHAKHGQFDEIAATRTSNLL